MAIAKIIFRKMLNNRWLVGSLFLGLLITSSLVSSIPTYSASVLSKLLLKELENYQIKENHYPGEFSFFIDAPKEKGAGQNQFLQKVEKINVGITKDAGLPIETKAAILSTAPMAVSQPDAPEPSKNKQQKYGSIISLSGIKDHIVLTDGRFPSESPVNGVYEVLVTELALQKRGIVLNTILLADDGKEKLKVKPVGTFKAKSGRDPYWFIGPDSYSDEFILPENTFRAEFIDGRKPLLDSIRLFTAFDYHAIQVDQFAPLLNLEGKTKASLSQISDSKVFVNFPISDLLVKYQDKSGQLKTMLWSLNIPLLIMLGIYLFMVTRLIIERQRNEIAVLNSRGARKSQILIIYLIELGFLSLLAFVLGPFIGLLLCKMLGATNGFLQFVQRSPLDLKIMKEAFLYELWAIIACILMMMIPIWQASSQSIVNHKRTMIRVAGNAVWYTIFIDLGLLAVSLYGWLTFSRRKQEWLALSDGNSFSVDPLLFFVPTAFIIGSGLLLLRIYPYFLKGLFRIGKRFWPLSLYSTLVQVSRASKQYLYLMIFLIMTIAIGVYSASAARTINTNLEEQLRYENGADLAVSVLWESENPSVSAASAYGPAQGNSQNGSKDNAAPADSKPIYTEPPFEPFLKLKEIAHATRVFRKDDVFAHAKGEDMAGIELMGIEPKDFGETAWFKTSLLPHHWYQYLNLLSHEPSAVLISNSVAKELGVKTGDYLTLNWNGTEQVEFVVYGIVEYWPSFNPIKVNEDEAGKTTPALVVANLPYVQNFMGLEPYEVWLKAKPNTTRESLYQDMKKQGIPLIAVQDVQPKLNDLKNGAFLLGINGTLSLGFVISVLITFIGFLIYWILTMKSRILQYGIYRAMGIPLRQLIGILFYEQLLTSGVACIFGIVIGSITSTLFVPLFQLSFNPNNVVPPFQVIFDAGDELRIYALVIFILLIGLTILGILLKNIRVHQAIKLGED